MEDRLNLLSFGGLTGLIQGALSVNVYLHDTYFVVGHFHYVMFGGTGFPPEIIALLFSFFSGRCLLSFPTV